MALLVWAKSVSPYKTPDPGIIKICTADCTVKFLLLNLVPGFPHNITLVFATKKKSPGPKNEFYRRVSTSVTIYSKN
jgi:hypothetical protein